MGAAPPADDGLAGLYPEVAGKALADRPEGQTSGVDRLDGFAHDAPGDDRIPA